MSRARHLLPYPVLSAALLLAWLLLQQSASAAQLLLGALLATLVPMLTRRFAPECTHLGRPWVAIRLAGRLLWDILRANLVVARLVLGPRAALQPRFVVLPLELEDPLATALLAGAISLTPGTVSAEVDREAHVVLVHCLHVEDPAALIGQIKQRYEYPLKEIFRC